VTDDSGTVVYSAAYDPYGGIQRTWENTYDPKLRFSGKERDSGSGLDYFGARHYGHSSYRFISTDPVLNREEAISNPQLWNLYSYCRNNPVTFVDPDGETDIVAPYNPELNRHLNARIAAFVNNAWLPKFAKSLLIGMLHQPETREEFALEFTTTMLGFAGAIESQGAKMALARRLGKEGEIAAGIIGRKQRIYSEIFSTVSRYRVPDEVTEVSLREIKNVLRLSNTAQIREYFEYAQQSGRAFIIETRANTKMASILKREIERGNIIHKIIGR
jgi:RHS repeat-associated protein